MSDLCSPVWFRNEAHELATRIEARCPEFGCHVALTGGLLYKDNAREDCDLLFYRIRQKSEIAWQALAQFLESEIGVQFTSQSGWLWQGKLEGKPIDFFFPEELPKSSFVITNSSTKY